MSDVVYIGPGGRERRPRPLLRKLLGEVLRRRRLQQRRTLADVARAARISMPYLSEVERGRKEASSEVLAAVCEALRIELSDVLTEVGRVLAMDRTPVVRLEATRLDRAGVPSAVDRAHRPGSVERAHRPGDIVLLAA